MIKLEQATIVEGKYDKIKLSSIIDGLIIETDGFGIFKDKEKQKLIRRLAEEKGIIIMTDSDSAGFRIRSFLGGSIPGDRITHVYIPDIFGKEKRKTEASKEGKLGVEGVPTQIILKALERAGVTCTESDGSGKREITNLDLYELGLSGCADSRRKREKLLKYLELPTRLSTSSFVKVLNTFTTYDDLIKKAEECFSQEEKI
ncbi:MAG: toprim domain-containing protein [Acutalibacteraceae bacterium]|nr:DUF4093 domain-containing protein [Oscillospiraceae bacterium]